MAEARFIKDLKGVLYYLDTPLLEFEIKDHELIRTKDLSDHKFYPWELAELGVSYSSFNKFFRRRTMREGCMFYREHLRALGMETMDFDRYIRLNNGNNHLDNYWVRFDDFGARSFRDIMDM